MSFDNIWQWSETAASNTAIASTDITGATGKVKDGDNAIRAMMAQIITAEGKGADVSSGGTVTLGEQRYYHITGTTTITDIDFTDAVNGRWAWLIFDDALTLTHNSGSLKLPGGANITTAAGDRALFIQDSGNNIICLDYVRAVGFRLLDAIAGLTGVNGGFIRFTGSNSAVMQAINGTVSETSGVATGALFENGSNANGSYQRTAGGFQWCGLRDFATSQNPTTLSGSVYTLVLSAWTYPAAFAAQAFSHIRPRRTSGSGVAWDSQGTGTNDSTTASFPFHLTASTNGWTGDVHISATGVWFT